MGRGSTIVFILGFVIMFAPFWLGGTPFMNEVSHMGVTMGAGLVIMLLSVLVDCCGGEDNGEVPSKKSE
jgi:hypothetical protein